MSSIPNVPTKLTPIYPPPSSFINSQPPAEESPTTQSLLSALNLQRHIEGGYFAELDRNHLLIPNPFLSNNSSCTDIHKEEGEDEKKTAPAPLSGNNAVRNASTSIYYLLTRAQPQGGFHRNRGRTIHTLISGRGRYVIIHADEEEAGDKDNKKKRVESFVVGMDYAKGEKSVWVVEGGKYKASFLLDGAEGERLLISETVIPGFEYSDHDFLTEDKFRKLVTHEQAEELKWLVRKA